jgi:hypothetical protein
MARERIDNLSEADRLKHEYKQHHQAYFDPNITPFVGGQHGVTGQSIDGIEADFAMLRDAERKLADLHDQLMSHYRAAEELTEPLSDGTSPVTGPMRKLFHSRADVEGGVQATLLDYMEELINVRVAILQTLQTYEGVEGETVNQLQRQTLELEEIA